MNTPLVSIILPVYNREGFVRRAIESVFAQTYSHWELIAIDDGSTDRTPEILRSYTDHRVRLFVQPNAGPYPARNYGLSQATGEFIAFLDSDDLWYPHKLELQLPLFSRSEVGLVCGNAIIMDYRHQEPIPWHRTYYDLWPPSRKRAFETLLGYDFVSEMTAIVRRRCFERLGPFSLAGRVSADYAKWIHIAMHYDIDFVSEPVGEIGVHDDNWSRNAERRYESQILLFEELLTQAPSARDQQGLQHLLYNVGMRMTLDQWRRSPWRTLPAETSLEKAHTDVAGGRRIIWFLQFFIYEIRSWMRLLLNKAGY